MNVKRYNCSNTLDYGHELQRMCSSINDCWMCPIHHDSGVCKSKISSESISAVQNWSDNHPEKRDLTEDEMNILKAFKALGFKYITADKDGGVCAYIFKPQKGTEAWYNDINDSGYVCETEKFFGGIVSWEDEEPAEIEDLLKEVEQK